MNDAIKNVMAAGSSPSRDCLLFWKKGWRISETDRPRTQGHSPGKGTDGRPHAGALRKFLSTFRG